MSSTSSPPSPFRASKLTSTVYHLLSIPIVYNHGFWYAICNPAAFTEVSSASSLVPPLHVSLFELIASPCSLSSRFDLLYQKLEFYYIINYYIKYYELLDTVFLVLKKKNLG